MASASAADAAVGDENSVDGDVLAVHNTVEKIGAVSTDTADELSGGFESKLGDTNTQKNFTDLNNEIGTPSTGTTVYLEGTYVYETTDSSFVNGVEITTNDITIDGQGQTTIDGNYLARAFKITASGVTIKNLTIKNCNYNGEGGAIYFNNEGSVEEGSVEYCNFTNNTATRRGGAVCIYGNAHVTNCNFNNNTATNYAEKSGGAIYFDVNAHVTNCNFNNNKATDNGGAVFLRAGNANVTNCNFTNNTANRQGGAVYITYGNANITNCNFNNNTVTTVGGAICFEMEGNVEYCNFTNNTATTFGGAIYFNNNAHVTNCNFNNNKATGNYGGAFYGGIANVTNCNFTNNTARANGGAAHIYGNANVTNCNFNNNKVTSSNGGAVYFESNADVTNCNFVGNTGNNRNIYHAKSLTLENNKFFDTINLVEEEYDYYVAFTVSSTIDSGVNNYEITSPTAQINDTPSKTYLATISGQTFSFNVPQKDLNPGTYTFTGTDGNNNEFILNSTQTFTVVKGDGTFSSLQNLINSASAGDVINLERNYKYNTTTDSQITVGVLIANKDNLIINGNGHTIDAKGQKSAFVITSSGVTIKNLTIKNCNIAANGGAIYFGKSGSVENCNFEKNNATGSSGYGGAVYFWDSGNVTNCSFTNNSVSMYGGAVHFQGNGNVTNCNFTNNTARCGGAVSFATNGTVENCNFTKNTATGTGNDRGGGAVYSNGNLSVENSMFTENNATNGGAVYIYSDKTLTLNTVSAYNNTHTTEDLTYKGTFYVVGATLNKDNLVLGESQDIWDGNVHADVIYISPAGQTTNYGLTRDTPTTWDNALSEVNPNGEIVFVKGEYTFGASKSISMNVTLVGDGSILKRSGVESLFLISNSAVVGIENFTMDAGVQVTDGSTLNIDNITFTATDNGANSIIFENNAAGGSISNSVFKDTSALKYSHLVYVTVGTVDIDHVNFTNNAKGAIYYTNAGGGSVTNSIFDSNQDSDERNIFHDGNGVVNINNNEFRDATITIATGSGIYGHDLTVSGTIDAGVSGQINTLTLKLNDTAATERTSNVDTNKAFSFIVEGGILAAGSYNVTATTDLNGNSYTLTANEFTVSKAESNIVIDDIAAVTYPNAAEITYTTNSAVNDVAVYVKDTTTTAGNINIGTNKVTVSNLDAGAYTIKITVKDDNHTEKTETKDFTVKQGVATVALSGKTSIIEGESTTITATTTNSNGIAATIGTVSGSGNSYYIAISGLSVGSHTLTVTTTPKDGNYTASSKSVTITVSPKVIPSTVVIPKSTTIDYGSIANITANTTGASAITATLYNGSTKIKDITPVGFVIPVDVNGLTIANYTLKVTTIPLSGYTPATAEGRIIVKKAVPALNVDDIDPIVYGSETIILVANYDGDYTVIVGDGEPITVSDVAAGKEKIVNIGKLDANDYTVKVQFKGNENYTESNIVEKNLTVTKANVTITITAVDVTYPGDVIVNVSSDVSGTYFLFINTTSPQEIELEAGTAKEIQIPGLNAGTYEFTLAYLETDNYNAATESVNITVNPTTSFLTIEDINTTVRQETNIIAHVFDSNGLPINEGNVTFFDGKSNIGNANVINGIARLNYAPPYGEHTFSAVYLGNNYLSSKNNLTVFIDRKEVVVTSSNITTVYNSNDSLVVNVRDTNGLAVSDALFIIKIDNEPRIFLTDENGQIEVPTKEFIPKFYSFEISVADDRYSASNVTGYFVVNKASTKLTASSVITTYNVVKKLVVTLKDSDEVLANKKVTVKVGKISKTLKTNSKGQISVDVSILTPKAYTASIKFAGDKYYSSSSKSVKVTVKKANPKLTAKVKSFKKSVKTKKYSITLKTNKNKAMKKTKVTLKVKGKTYTAKTNSKGKATFKITNLNKKGTFTAVVKYAGNSCYNAKTVKPKIIVK